MTYGSITIVVKGRSITIIVSAILQTLSQSVFLLKIEISCGGAHHVFFFPFNNPTLQKAAPGWYHLSGFRNLQFVRVPIDIEATLLSVPGSNLVSTDRKHLASFSASSATEAYRGISVIVPLSLWIL